ncbi:hypothetical protein F885_02564 [Acinetobacter higginsii]|nr:hypothetical protein F885_02564 [Acinetobacter higginsii]
MAINETDWTMQHIRIGQLREHESMQVVTGHMDYPTAHFKAPAQDDLEQCLDEFIQWFNTRRANTLLDPLI